MVGYTLEMKHKKIVVPALCLFFLAGSVSCSSEDGKQTQQPVGEEVPVVTETPEEPQPVQETQAVQDVAPVIEETEDGTIDNTEPTDPSAVPVVEISYPVEVTIEQTFCNAGDGDCWDYRTSAPSFYACEDSNDAAFRAANCTEENITVLVNKECGRVENSARPQSYQYYVIFNPSDTKFILNVTDTTGNYWGAHSNADLNPGSWVGHNFQWNLYNGVTYDIRGELTLEDGTVAAEFPLYSQTKNC